MNLMGTSMWGMGFSIVQARLRKLLKRLNASPMRRRAGLPYAGANPGTSPRHSIARLSKYSSMREINPPSQ